MRLRFDVSFGNDSRRKAVVRKKDAGVLYPVGGTSRGGWWPVIRESFTGAWQRNIEVNFDSALAFHAVYSCVTLILNDFGKLCERTVRVGRRGADLAGEGLAGVFSGT